MRARSARPTLAAKRNPVLPWTEFLEKYQDLYEQWSEGDDHAGEVAFDLAREQGVLKSGYVQARLAGPNSQQVYQGYDYIDIDGQRYLTRAFTRWPYGDGGVLIKRDWDFVTQPTPAKPLLMTWVVAWPEREAIPIDSPTDLLKFLEDQPVPHEPASGKKNPGGHARDPGEVFDEYKRLLQDPDPATCEIIEDLLLENEMTLAQVSRLALDKWESHLPVALRWSQLRSASHDAGLFVIDPSTTGTHPDNIKSSPGRTVVEWFVQPLNNEFRIHVDVSYENKVWPSTPFTRDSWATMEDAVHHAVDHSWHAVKAMKEMRGRPFDEVQLSVDGSPMARDVQRRVRTRTLQPGGDDLERLRFHRHPKEVINPAGTGRPTGTDEWGEEEPAPVLWYAWVIVPADVKDVYDGPVRQAAGVGYFVGSGRNLVVNRGNEYEWTFSYDTQEQRDEAVPRFEAIVGDVGRVEIEAEENPAPGNTGVVPPYPHIVQPGPPVDEQVMVPMDYQGAELIDRTVEYLEQQDAYVPAGNDLWLSPSKRDNGDDAEYMLFNYTDEQRTEIFNRIMESNAQPNPCSPPKQNPAPGNTKCTSRHCRHTSEEHERMGWTCDLWPVGGPCCGGTTRMPVEIEPDDSPKQNPAWVTKHLADSWVTLEQEVPAAWMPRLDMTVAKGKRLTAEIPEYGCGAYGCVLPTLDPKIVLKLTTDDTEAQFAARLAKTLPVPIVTTYELVYHLPTAKRQGRDVYLLWRESAEHVGEVDKVVGRHAEEAIAKQHKAAQAAFDRLHHGEPAERELRAWTSAVKGMGKVPELRWLADGMLAAYEKTGIFFGDIHGGNLGQARGQWVITDPGHVAVVKR